MDTEERRALRNLLIDQGFDRVGYSPDLEGAGSYVEWWERDGNEVRITWKEKS